MIAVFSQRTDGTALLSLGYPNGQGEFQAFVVLARQAPGRATGTADEPPRQRGAR
jgi:hypothetical protein